MSPSRCDCEGRWRRLNEEVMGDIQEWRRQHSRAPLEESARAVEERLARLRACLRQDGALASRATDLPQTAAAERPVGPTGQVGVFPPRGAVGIAARPAAPAPTTEREAVGPVVPLDAGGGGHAGLHVAGATAGRGPHVSDWRFP